MKSINTPWGMSQSIETYGDNGIFFAMTAGHGGVFVPAEVLATWPECLKRFKTFCGSPSWFEEDCDCVIPMLAHPELFEPKAVLGALTASNRYGYYAKKGFSFEEYILTDAGVRANQMAIEASNYEVATV